jgi:putative hydroxymethylpyrimidine transport system substrate-binding protein
VNRLRPLLMLGAATVILLGGCGGGSDTGSEAIEQSWTYETLRLNLDWDPGPENVGPVLADALGYFQDVKLGPWINAPIYPERPTKYVDERLVDAAIAQAPQVVLAQEEGRPVVAFGSLVPEATMAMIWLPDSGIDEIADLKGKTIAYPGVPFQKDFLRYVLEGAGLSLADVKLADVGYELAPALASGRADAIFGGSANEEGVLLEAQGLDPVVTEATDLGIPDYDELVLIARRDRYAKDPELFQRILDASIRGNEAAGEDPRAAAEAIVEQSFGEAPLKPGQAGVEATASLLSQSGEIDEARLEALIEWMYEQGMTKRKLPVSALLAGP